jgi:GNAT superfamily N-acetyltransferase
MGAAATEIRRAQIGDAPGWMHVEHRSSLEGGIARSSWGSSSIRTLAGEGLGRDLVDVAENWALSRGLSSLTVRSNAARELSHPFYEALGYAREKTQHVYRKTLASAARR